jgi:hypothetical protein
MDIVPSDINSNLLLFLKLNSLKFKIKCLKYFLKIHAGFSNVKFVTNNIFIIQKSYNLCVCVCVCVCLCLSKNGKSLLLTVLMFFFLGITQNTQPFQAHYLRVLLGPPALTLKQFYILTTQHISVSLKISE